MLLQALFHFLWPSNIPLYTRANICFIHFCVKGHIGGFHAMLNTTEQAEAALRACQWLSLAGLSSEYRSVPSPAYFHQK